jgi:uncharacterized membrane protein YhaH (DUF805 family)
MTFGNSVKSGFEKYFDFTGRASRSEFWWWILFCFLLSFGCALIDISFGWGKTSIDGNGPLATLSVVITFLPSLAVSVRRLHDSDRSAWWLWGPFVGWSVFLFVIFIAVSGRNDESELLALFVGAAGLGLLGVSTVVFVFYCLPGSRGANRYGPSLLPRHVRQQETSGDRQGNYSDERGGATRWVLSGFDSAGNIIRLEFSLTRGRNQRFVIGRHRDTCDLVISDQGVSRQHAEIIVDDGGAQIRDLGSSNGTLLNGQKLTYEPLPFPVNGSLTLGPVELSIFGS